MGKKVYLLGFIILIGAVLRLYNLTNTPPSLYWDEVSLGYNAYSIAETGHDEHGEYFPFIFRGYDDFKFPGYIYLTAVFVYFLGLSELTTRLPGALIGTASVFFIFILTHNLFSRLREKKDSITFSLAAAFLFAISPWSINFSRAAFEANVALGFVILGFALILQKKKSHLMFVLGLIFLLFSLHTYRSELIFVPLLLSVSLTLFFKDFFSAARRKITVISLVVFMLLSLPIYYHTFLGEASARQNQVSVLEGVDKKIGEYSEQIINSTQPRLGNIFLNYRIAYIDVFLNNYIPQVSPSFLFLEGDPNPRHGAPYMGVLYLWESITLILGFIFLTKVNKKVGIFLGAWVIIGILPAALTTPTPHALRALTILPPLIIISSGGLYYAFILLKKWRMTYLAVTSLVIAFFFAQFLYLYFSVLPKNSSHDWGGGYKEIVEYVEENNEEYERIIVTGHYWNPYMYFLFYNKYDPAKFQRNGSISGFGIYTFGGTSWDKDRYSKTLAEVELDEFSDKATMIILSPNEFEQQKEKVNELTRIQDISGKNIFIVTEIK